LLPRHALRCNMDDPQQRPPPKQQTAEALERYQNDEIAKWWSIIKAADVKVE
jgi:hypothetical protein